MTAFEIFTCSSINLPLYNALSNFIGLFLWKMFFINIVMNYFTIQLFTLELFFYQTNPYLWWSNENPLCRLYAWTNTWKFLFYFYFDIFFKPFRVTTFAVIRMPWIAINPPKRTHITSNEQHLKLYYVTILLKTNWEIMNLELTIFRIKQKSIPNLHSWLCFLKEAFLHYLHDRV